MAGSLLIRKLAPCTFWPPHPAPIYCKNTNWFNFKTITNSKQKTSFWWWRKQDVFYFLGLCLRLMVFHGGITVINVRGVGTKRPAEDKILFLPLFKENLLINGEGLSLIILAVINLAKYFIRSRNPLICLVHGHFCTFWGVLGLLNLKGRLENNIMMSHDIKIYYIQLCK